MRVQSYTKRRVQKSDKAGSTTELGLSRVKQDWQGFLLRPTGCSFFYTLFCVDVIRKQEWCMNLLLWEIVFEIFFKVLSFVWVWLFSQGKMVCWPFVHLFPLAICRQSHVSIGHCVGVAHIGMASWLSPKLGWWEVSKPTNFLVWYPMFFQTCFLQA